MDIAATQTGYPLLRIRLLRKPYVSSNAKTGWQGSFEGWAHKFLKSNFWRVAHVFDYSDAVQECALVFAKVQKHYRGSNVNEPKWLMSLFQTSVANHFHTLSNKVSCKKWLEVTGNELVALHGVIKSDMMEALFDIRNLKRKDGVYMSVYEELKERLNLPGKPPVTDLIQGISMFDADGWNALSPAAQSWYNSAAAAANQGNPVPECPGQEEFSAVDEVVETSAHETSDQPSEQTESEADSDNISGEQETAGAETRVTDEGAAEEVQPKPARRGRPKKAVADAKDVKKVAKIAKVRKPRSDVDCREALYEVLLANPTINVVDAHAALVTQRVKFSRENVMRYLSSGRRLLVVLERHGLLNQPASRIGGVGSNGDGTAPDAQQEAQEAQEQPSVA